MVLWRDFWNYRCLRSSLINYRRKKLSRLRSGGLADYSMGPLLGILTLWKSDIELISNSSGVVIRNTLLLKVEELLINYQITFCISTSSVNKWITTSFLQHVQIGLSRQISFRYKWPSIALSKILAYTLFFPDTAYDHLSSLQYP